MGSLRAFSEPLIVVEKTPESLLYAAMLKAENKVGGGEGLEGVYGSITKVGTTDVLDAFKEHAGLCESSVVLDIGSGLGRPLLHAILHSGIKATYGIEVDAVKCQKACPFITLSIGELAAHGIHIPISSLPKFICAPIEQIPSLEPATHIYAAWEGFATAAKEAVGKLFSQSRTAKAFTIVQRSFRNRDGADEMRELGFGNVRQVAAIPVYMSGSRRKLNAYCFVREDMPPAAPKRKARASSEGPPLDLSTMPGFSPENVIGVLASQATGRATAKFQATESYGAVDDTTSVRDSRPRRNPGIASGRLRDGARSEQPEELMGAQENQLTFNVTAGISQHCHGLRKRGAARSWMGA